ncbi:methylmalonyl-CoA mutase subunit beta [Mariniflexile litorale]|uniref:Methylmalonyl-CoA mutase subunit beta n=1 Tax=Mariniflexile litorale TaxID=3045158 RepID=A0AAU7EJG5_9FLAO|nr:methylmalonyl-CoA mutase subunit beta [Mariniflexile sp. KMM 9835]MDQ8210014.1 methylmalonyl-CoA mutase subunit beta [Mariniflexile sp. KMM 9835]
MISGLFDEFDSVSAKQWKQKIQFDLNGADYNETLIWKSNEDISVKPFYNSEDLKELPEVSNTKATQWNICQTVFVANIEKSNKKALKSVQRGAESIKFIIPNESISIKQLLENLDDIPVFFELQFLSEKFIEQINSISAKAHIHIDIDIIGNLAKTGNWFNNLNDDFTKFKNIVKQTQSFNINVALYENAGANMVQQLAYALAHANEYLNALDNDFNAETKQTLQITFDVSVGSNYFFEIAKLRALRLLWSTLASEYQINTQCHITATPTKRNKTIYDYNTNLLRTTTECMSAVLGGANTICNLPYDVIYKKANAFSERMARNQLLILKHESYFDKINNPSDGAYYIESLTNQLAEKSLALFKDIERNGGFLKQLKENTIQRKIKESANKEQQQFDTGETILLGTNKHPNPNDAMKDELELYPFVKTHQRKTLIEPIIEKRLAETLEQERLKNE